VDDLKHRTKITRDHDFGNVGFKDEDFTANAITKMVDCLDSENKFD
jgi:hypothetical protein